MQKRTKSIVLGLAVLALVVAGIAAASRGRNESTIAKIEKVERRDLTSSVTASGQVEAHTKIDLSSDISGRVVRMSVKDGDEVTKGQFLLQIDPASYEAAVARAKAAVAQSQAQLTQAQANLAQAQRAYDRTSQLKKLNPTLVSADQLDQLHTALQVNAAMVQADKEVVSQGIASLQDAQSGLAKTTILAPMSGKITQLNIQLGETATPGTFSKDIGTLLTISDMSSLETKIDVDETDVSRIAVGDTVLVQMDALPDSTFAGRVTEISNSPIKQATPGSTSQAVNYEVTVRLLNAPARAKPGFSATAKVITAIRHDALTIPIVALTVQENTALISGDTSVGIGQRPAKALKSQDVEGVFVVDGKTHKVTFRPVKVGIAGERYFEVLSGLTEGESIVAGTYQTIKNLKDGTTVRDTTSGRKTPL